MLDLKSTTSPVKINSLVLSESLSGSRRKGKELVLVSTQYMAPEILLLFPTLKYQSQERNS